MKNILVKDHQISFSCLVQLSAVRKPILCSKSSSNFNPVLTSVMPQSSFCLVGYTNGVVVKSCRVVVGYLLP